MIAFLKMILIAYLFYFFSEYAYIILIQYLFSWFDIITKNVIFDNI